MSEQTDRTAGIREPLLLSPRQAAQALGVCEKTVYNLTRSGELPVVRLGRAVRYSLGDLREWIRCASKKKCEDGQDNT
ncbi:MAG: helix-turn-helix domain-containing protein [Planctomycetota bacterium]|jgi:excisionase family DNA binding protein